MSQGDGVVYRRSPAARICANGQADVVWDELIKE